MVVAQDQPGGQFARARALVVARAAEDGLTGLSGALRSVCLTACDELDAAGAAVHLMTSQGHEGVAASSDRRASELGELSFTAGEGPVVDAWQTSRPVLAGDLAPLAARWPGYVGRVLEGGIRGVFAFPLTVGAVGFGVLELYLEQVRDLDEHDLAVAMNLARVATEILFDGRGSDGSGALDLLASLDHRMEIHQAQGIVMVALGISLVDSLMRLRARSFSVSLPLLELARQVIAGTVDPQEWGP